MDETANGKTTKFTIDGKTSVLTRKDVFSLFDKKGNIETYTNEKRKPLLFGKKHWNEQTQNPMQHILSGTHKSRKEMEDDAMLVTNSKYETWKTNKKYPVGIVNYASEILNELVLEKEAGIAESAMQGMGVGMIAGGVGGAMKKDPNTGKSSFGNIAKGVAVGGALGTAGGAAIGSGEVGVSKLRSKFSAKAATVGDTAAETAANVEKK